MASAEENSDSAEENDDISAKEALQMLLDGNSRFVSGDITHNGQDMVERRIELVAGQHPIAVIVGCSDSRISPEIIFDQGLGDIFVVRTAGQVMDNASLGSIEYAVEHLEVPLVVVLGHEGCGAVTATLEGGEAPGHINHLVESIQPAVDEARKTGNESELLDNSINNNIKNIQIDMNKASPILSEKIHSGELEIVAARYNMETGIVAILD